MGSSTTDPRHFKAKAEEWRELFLKPTELDPVTNEVIEEGLYRPADLTPYIHVLVSHVWEFMNKHREWGLDAFSCSGVEKKTMIMFVISLASL